MKEEFCTSVNEGFGGEKTQRNSQMSLLEPTAVLDETDRV